jgi:hypothetical protein
MEKKGIFGPSDCEQTIDFAEKLPSYVVDILRRYGCDINPEEITTPDGTRISSFNLERGIVIPAILKGYRTAVRREIDEIGKIPVTFLPPEKELENSHYQRQILEFC